MSGSHRLEFALLLQAELWNLRTVPGVWSLLNGERYFIYRLMLYCDAFCARSPLFSRGSVGEC